MPAARCPERAKPPAPRKVVTFGSEEALPERATKVVRVAGQAGKIYYLARIDDLRDLGRSRVRPWTASLAPACTSTAVVLAGGGELRVECDGSTHGDGNGSLEGRKTGCR